MKFLSKLFGKGEKPKGTADISVVEAHIAALTDKDETVRTAAAEALTMIGAPAVEPLISLLDKYHRWSQTDTNSLQLRIEIANLLGKIGDPRAIKVLIEMGSARVFTSDPRRAAPGRVWVDSSGKTERMETWDHRSAAGDALARIGEPAVGPLIAALKDERADLRHLAAWALGKIGDTRAVEPLIPVLSSHYHDRAAAREALKAITGQDFGEDVDRWREWSRGFAPGCGPHTDQVNAVAVTPDGRWAVSGSRDKTIKVWDIESSKLVVTHTGPAREVNSVTVTPDGKRILFGTRGEYVKQGLQVAEIDSKVTLWDLHSGKEIASFRHDGGVSAVAMTPDGRRVVSGSGHGSVKVWNLESGKEEITFGYDESGVPGICSLAITPDGRQVVSASGFGNIKGWNLETGKEEFSFSGHKDIAYTVAISPDGRRIISGSRDKTLKVWDLASGEELATLSGHDEGVNAIAVTPDGQFAISASSDKTLKIWDLSRKCEIHTLKGHTEKVCAVAITPDGRYVLSASADTTLKIWSLDRREEVGTFTGIKTAERH
jgi:WD40 repeat protein